MLMFSSISPLRFLFYFKYTFLSHSSIDGITTVYPNVANFDQNEKLLINNFNLSLLLILIPIMCILVTWLRSKKFKQQHLGTKITQKTEKQMQKLDSYITWSWVGLMYGMLINLQYFVECSAVFFKYSATYSSESVAIFAVTTSLIVLTILLFYKQPMEFDYFRTSFDKQSQLALIHYHFYFLLLISIVTVLVLLPSFSAAAAIPIFILFIYTLFKRPYEKQKENYRAAFNLFVMCVFAGFKIYIENCSKSVRNSTLTFVFILLCILLLVAVVLYAWATMIYYFYYDKYVYPVYELPIKIIRK